MFVLTSDIKIGGFRFSGVNSVRTSRSMHSLVDTATITLPAMAKIVKNGNQGAVSVITGEQFKDGDPVTIMLGYNGDLQTEFKGFVKHRDMNMPLEISCEGYSWLLKRNKVNISMQSVSVKDLLAIAVSGIDARYPIAIQCELDCTLNNIQVNGTGFDIISKILEYTDGTATCFFAAPDVLWCGLAKTQYATSNNVLKKGNVQYMLGYNVFKNNTLKERTTADDAVEVKYSKKLPTGALVSQSSDAFKTATRKHSKILNQIANAPTLKLLANEKAYAVNYKGYEGSVQTFLDPYVSPGYTAFITDSMFKDKEGTYLVEGVETHFGVDGARRKVEIGLLVGFAK